MATQTQTSITCPVDFHDRKAVRQFFQELSDTSALIDHTNPNVDLKGALLRFSVADGYAAYVVVKNKPLTLSHVACGDAWRVDDALIRGIRRDDILKQLGKAAFWRSLMNAPPTM